MIAQQRKNKHKFTKKDVKYENNKIENQTQHEWKTKPNINTKRLKIIQLESENIILKNLGCPGSTLLDFSQYLIGRG